MSARRNRAGCSGRKRRLVGRRDEARPVRRVHATSDVIRDPDIATNPGFAAASGVGCRAVGRVVHVTTWPRGSVPQLGRPVGKAVERPVRRVGVRTWDVDAERKRRRRRYVTTRQATRVPRSGLASFRLASVRGAVKRSRAGARDVWRCGGFRRLGVAALSPVRGSPFSRGQENGRGCGRGVIGSPRLSKLLDTGRGTVIPLFAKKSRVKRSVFLVRPFPPFLGVTTSPGRGVEVITPFSEGVRTISERCHVFWQKNLTHPRPLYGLGTVKVGYGAAGLNFSS